MSPPALLAIDWGSSQLRGALLAADGAVLDQLSAPRGLLQVPDGGWGGVFDEVFGPWLARHPGLPALMSGMVGSRQGWREAPYAACPATLADLAERLAWVDDPADPRQPGVQPGRPARCAIVPGLSTMHQGVPDVMRGEETQVFGALAGLGLGAAEAVTLVLPGTHSKWVQVGQGRITGFSTHMTGEAFALFRQHSILARTLPPVDAEPAWDAAAFDAGVRRAQAPGGLLHHLFGVRSQALFDLRSPAALASYLSGLVIGEELRAQAPTPQQPLVLVGSDTLLARYQRALQLLGVPSLPVGEAATWAGLLAVARSAGWL